MYNKPQINVFSPHTRQDKIDKIAEFCNDKNLDWRHLLDIGTSKLLRSLLDENDLDDHIRYSKCRNYADEAVHYLNDKVGNDRLRFRGIAYLLKSMCGTMFQVGYNTPCHIEPELQTNFFTPITSSISLEAISQCCQENEITALELLDVGLSLYGVEEVIADYSPPREIAMLDADRIGSGALAGKMLNGYLRYLGASVLDRVIVTLLMTKAAAVNLLGVCGKKCSGDCSC
ncbi:hypothetical protein [Desulfoscipio gibsoniae]|uniref:Uncharacterized protein n=1 Tax=Desulfoscipio gibsoniae DSM 7213 TaxID=767817 RepID=R4KV02_9FIRM|nr:hypothetical protein [Desulfoscipio gibsoniae]AGL03446.1 hypothetical protein Desgi_4192 [Desulfoscipio gibsoniae DSM 7213]